MLRCQLASAPPCLLRPQMISHNFLPFYCHNRSKEELPLWHRHTSRSLRARLCRTHCQPFDSDSLVEMGGGKGLGGSFARHCADIITLRTFPCLAKASELIRALFVLTVTEGRAEEGLWERRRVHTSPATPARPRGAPCGRWNATLVARQRLILLALLPRQNVRRFWSGVDLWWPEFKFSLCRHLKMTGRVFALVFWTSRCQMSDALKLKNQKFKACSCYQFPFSPQWDQKVWIMVEKSVKASTETSQRLSK